MTRAPRYDLLFEPVPIGPVTARNRFFQVPHCSGMGHRHPSAEAAMRGVKAQGGWAVVSTREVEIHPTSEVSPFAEGRLWDERDIPALARVADAIHEGGALAAIEPVLQGFRAANRYSLATSLAPSHQPVDMADPVQARAMNRADIRELRRWYRQAALRSRKAGFDLIYVYAGHNLSVAMHFLSRSLNRRSK